MFRVSVDLLNGKPIQCDVNFIEEIYRKMEQEHSHRSPLTIAALHNWGWSLAHVGKYPEAEAVMKKILKWTVDTGTGILIETQAFTTMNTLARILERLGKLDEAIHFSTRAVSICERYAAQDSQYLLESERRLAILLEKNGKLKQAEDLYKKVLKGRMERLGKHEYTSGSLTDYKTVLQSCGKEEKAQNVEKQVLRRLHIAT